MAGGPAAGGCWLAFLEDFLGGLESPSGEPEERPVAGTKKDQKDAAGAVNVPTTSSPAALVSTWSGDVTGAPLLGNVAPVVQSNQAGQQDAAADPGLAVKLAGLPQGSQMAPGCNLSAANPDASAPRMDLRGADPVRESTGALAFAARLLPVEPAVGSAASTQPPPTADAPTPAAAQPQTIPAALGSALVQDAGTPPPAHGSSHAPDTGGQNGNQGAKAPETAGSASNAAPDGGTAAAPAARGGASVGAAGSNAPSPEGHPPDKQDTTEHPGAQGFANVETPAALDRQAAPARTDPTPGVSQAHNVEPEAPVAPVQSVSRDVSLRMADGQSSVDIRLAERGGEIRVTVHTPDQNLADSLRADLPDLIGKLRQSGFQAETWRPAAASSPDAGRRSGTDTPSSHSDSAFAQRDGRQQQQSQRQARQQSQWAGEWQASLAPTQESDL